MKTNMFWGITIITIITIIIIIVFVAVAIIASVIIVSVIVSLWILPDFYSEVSSLFVDFFDYFTDSSFGSFLLFEASLFLKNQEQF